MLRMNPTSASPASHFKFWLSGYLACLVLCNALNGGVLDFHPGFAFLKQILSEPFYVPEIETGFHLLYQL
jgi:hypothetical protein